MIPAHRFHELERTRTKAEERASDLRMSEMAAAIAQLGSLLIVPLRFLRRLGQHTPVRWTAKRTLTTATEGQSLETGRAPSVDSPASFPRWWTFDTYVPGDAHAVSEDGPFSS
ncbi:MAG: hypothetical protein ABSB52_07670 [Acidimicrobiales bacterium]|jgi:hypothetical protein